VGIGSDFIGVNRYQHRVCEDAKTPMTDWLHAQEYIVGGVAPRKQFSDSLHILSYIHFYQI
jgi:hypothetical protein